MLQKACSALACSWLHRGVPVVSKDNSLLQLSTGPGLEAWPLLCHGELAQNVCHLSAISAGNFSKWKKDGMGIRNDDCLIKSLFSLLKKKKKNNISYQSYLSFLSMKSHYSESLLSFNLDLCLQLYFLLHYIFISQN